MIPSDIESYYKLHSIFYDITRWAFLFGRNSMVYHLPKLPKNSTILDLGCGTGKQLSFLQKKYTSARIIGIDRSKEMLSFASKIPGDQIDLKNEVYSNQSFFENSLDLVVCSYSLTMFDDVEETIEIIKTHLKPNGVILVVDFDRTPFNWFSKWMKKNHVSFESNSFELLRTNFKAKEQVTKKGYLGLYTYSVFCGYK